jgi:hypothetical protein
MAWILLAGAWFEATSLFVLDPDEITSRRHAGLALATTAMAVMTIGSAVGIAVRRWHPEPAPTPTGAVRAVVRAILGS